MSLPPGTTLGRYEIVEPLGAGGMGEVYLATDTGLDRQVAIKVLPERFASEPERLARFEQEARAAARLNHPHIAAVHDIGAEGEGDERLHYMVQEYLQGKTLREALEQGPLPLTRALEIGLEVAEALRAAHAAGIVHRDLKPDNVFVTEDGHAKVLDFGLAKLTELEAGAIGSESMSPTVLGTQTGAIMGTAGYMSPEQAQGEEVDHRADLFALGCLLYEMSTGAQPFPGENAYESIGRIVSREPTPVRELDPGLPADLERIVRKCLVKDRSRRCQTAGDLAADLRLLLADVEAGIAVPPPEQEGQDVAAATGPGWAGAAVLGLALAAIAILATWALTRPQPPPPDPIRRFAVDLPVDPEFWDGGARTVAISPDGSRIAFVADSQLWLQASEEREPTRLPVEGRSPTMVFFSPDGEEIGYWDEDEIWRLAIGAGAAVRVGPHPEMIQGASWADDGFIYAGSRERGIVRIAAGGGQPEVVVPRVQGEQLYGPQLLPGGEWILFTRAESLSSWSEASIVAQALDDDERIVLAEGGRDARLLRSGHLLYGRGNQLIAQSFDPERMQPLGSPVSVIQGVRFASLDVNGTMQYDVSERGDLIYFPVPPGDDGQNLLVWSTPEGNEPLPLGAADYISASLSPNGRRVAAQIAGSGGGSASSGGSDIWVFSVDRAGGVRLAPEIPGQDGAQRARRAGAPIWSPDGQWVYFQSQASGKPGIWRQRVDRRGDPQEVLPSPDGRSIAPRSISSDRDLLAFHIGDGVEFDVGILPLEEGAEPEMLLTSPANEGFPSLSPSGRYVAYMSEESGQPQVYVLDLQSDSRSLISSEMGFFPVWTRDGSKIFYNSVRGMYRVDVTTEPELSISEPVVVPLPPSNYAPWFDVTADGSRILQIQTTRPAGEDSGGRWQLLGIHNWFRELRERVPIDR